MLGIRPCGSAPPLATNDAFQSHLAHQPLYRATGDSPAFAPELMPDLAHSVDTEVIVPYPADFIAQLFVFLATHTGIFLTGYKSIIDRWLNRQDLAD